MIDDRASIPAPALTKIKMRADFKVRRAARFGGPLMTSTHVHSSCVTCPRRALTEWRELGASELELVDRHKHDRIIRPGQVLYNQGDPCEGIYCVKEGLIGERRVNAMGESSLVRLSHPGTTVGYRELLSKSPFRNSAEALQQSHVCFIGKSVVQQLLARSPALGERFLQRSLGDAEQMEDDLVEAKSAGVKTRLLHILMVLYERNGSHDPQTRYALDLPINRQNLAELIGSAPETISRTIRSLEKDNIAHFDGNHVVIPDLDLVFRQIS